MQFQAHRVLVSHHADLTVRFRDLSARILISSETSPMQGSFPNPLPELTIDLVSMLADPEVGTRTSANFMKEAKVVSSYIAPQSLECAVVFQDVAVAVYRLSTTATPTSPYPRDLDDKELVSIEHVTVSNGRRFRPYFMLLTGRGHVTSFAICDIGTLFDVCSI